MQRQGGGAWTAVAEGTRGLGAQLLAIAARREAEEQAEAERAQRLAMHEDSVAVQREGMAAQQEQAEAARRQAYEMGGFAERVEPGGLNPQRAAAETAGAAMEAAPSPVPGMGMGGALLRTAAGAMPESAPERRTWQYDATRDPLAMREGSERTWKSGESEKDRAARLEEARLQAAAAERVARISASARASSGGSSRKSPEQTGAEGIVQRYVVEGFDVNDAIGIARQQYPNADVGMLNAAAAEALAVEAQIGARDRSGRPDPVPPIIRNNPRLNELFGGGEGEAEGRRRIPGVQQGGPGPTRGASSTLLRQRAEWDRLAEQFGRERTTAEIGPRP